MLATVKVRNVRPQCTYCVNTGLERVSYGKQQIAQLSGNKRTWAWSLRLKNAMLVLRLRKNLMLENIYNLETGVFGGKKMSVSVSVIG
jgi:hypothetical protein